MRGLKPFIKNAEDTHKVARRVRAWIETIRQDITYKLLTSHAVCVRGLKPLATLEAILPSMSHAVCVRGLKPLATFEAILPSIVARRVRAWIETLLKAYKLKAIFGRTPCACVD